MAKQGSSTSRGRLDLESAARQGLPRQRDASKDPNKKPRGTTRATSAAAAAAAVLSHLVPSRPAAAPPRSEKFPPGSAWAVDELKFPQREPLEAKLRFYLRYAILAPSSHNSQPWRFKLDGDRVEIRADRARALPVADPDDREMIISCGAALYHLRLAMRCFGLPETTSLAPDPADHDLLAIVSARGDAARTSPVDVGMFRAIPRRRTFRHAFGPDPVPALLVKDLVDVAAAQGAAIVAMSDPTSRTKLASLVAEADHVQFQNAPFRRELASWMHHNRAHTDDGMPGYALGMSEVMSLAAPFIVRTFDIGNGRAARDQDLALHSPLLIVLGTERDDQRTWTAAGQALAALLLRAAANDVHASYLNQPCEIPQLRPHVAQLAPAAGHAQLILRLGYAPPGHALPHATPRRKLEDVVLR